MCMNNLPEVVTWKRENGSQTRNFQSHKSSALTTTPPGHVLQHCSRLTSTWKPSVEVTPTTIAILYFSPPWISDWLLHFPILLCFSTAVCLCHQWFSQFCFPFLIRNDFRSELRPMTLTFKNERFILHSFQKITTWVKWYRILLVFAFPTNFQLLKGAKALSIGTDHQPKKNHPLAGNIFSWFYDSRGKECCSLQACVDPRISTWHCSHLLLNTVLLGAHHPPLSTDISSRRANSSKVCGPCWDRQMDGRTTYRFIDVAPHSMSAVSSCQHMSLCKH